MIVAPECASAHIGAVQIEAHFAIPDMTQASFRDDSCLWITSLPIPILRPL